MNIRGIVALKLGNRVFLRPSYCECNQCPKVDITQARSLTDIDTVNVGDKMESYTGDRWYKVQEFTPNAELDAVDRLKDLLNSGVSLDEFVQDDFDEGFGRFKGKVSRHLDS